MRFPRALAGALLTVGLIAGCGGSSHSSASHSSSTPAATAPAAVSAAPAPTTQAQVPCPPPAGEGFMGVCSPKPVQVYPGGKTFPLTSPAPQARVFGGAFGLTSHGMFPDVSSWQGPSVGWASVKSWQVSHGWRPAGIFKMGEYGIDPYAAHNNSALQSLGMWRAGYWFVRPTGCNGEYTQIANEGHALGLKIIVLDVEVPQVPGYAGCLTPALKKAGFTVVIYTAPGTWPSGSGFGAAPLWQATYGPSFSPFWQPVVAWQCTDGAFGCVTSVPGIGNTDVSIDYGITSLGVAPAPPPDPYRGYPKTRFSLPFGVHASEYNTVKTWDQLKCLNPVRRPSCKSTHFHLQLLRDRVYFVATHQVVKGRWVAIRGKPRWAYPKGQPLGSRFAGMSHRLEKK